MSCERIPVKYKFARDVRTLLSYLKPVYGQFMIVKHSFNKEVGKTNNNLMGAIEKNKQ